MNGWTHVRANGGMGLEEQELLRWQGKPVCSLKRTRTGWSADLLNLDGLGAVTHSFLFLNEDTMKRTCEHMLRKMGWTP